jgi:hypothetical protein
MLLSLFGGRDPSSLGHQGAEKMLADVWADDAGSGAWVEVRQEGDGPPAPRGWFAADVVGEGKIVLQGGLAENNSRLGHVRIGEMDVYGKTSVQ